MRDCQVHVALFLGQSPISRYRRYALVPARLNVAVSYVTVIPTNPTTKDGSKISQTRCGIINVSPEQFLR